MPVLPTPSAFQPYKSDALRAASLEALALTLFALDASASPAAALLPAVRRTSTAAQILERRCRPLLPADASARSTEAVVKLPPREHQPATVAPIALATSATETGQKRPE